MTDPSPRPPMPRGAAAAIAAVASLALLAGLLATTTVASNVGRIARFDDAIGRFRSSSFELGALGALGVLGVQPVLRGDYIASVVGDAFDPADREPAGGGEPAAEAAAPSESAERPPPTTTTTAPRGLVERILTGDARLAARMIADRETVAPGEEVEYTVVLSNTGTSTIRGNIEIESHVPLGTLDARRQCDSEVGINVDPDHLCASTTAAPAPGAGDQTHQVVITSSGQLPPGEERSVTFRVRVAEVAPSGTEISNHAHANLIGDGERAVTTEPVVVVVS